MMEYHGTTFERLAFQKMIADIEEKKINMVITKDLSRLGRDYIKTGYYIENYFPEHSIRYVSILDGIDTYLDSNNNELKDNSRVGTATKVIFKRETGEIAYEYVFILYGDVNGDGLLNSLDVLVIQKHILETKKMNEIFKKAGNLLRNGEEPNSLDVLKLQRHILEIKFIQQ